MRIFKTRVFGRFCQRQRIEDASLREAIRRAEQGLIDADLGDGVIKQRIARPGEGRSGGFRTIILLRIEERAVFVYGFAKNERENITAEDLRRYREAAVVMMNQSDEDIEIALADGNLMEIPYENLQE